MKDTIIHDHHHDGIDRRGFLKCMAWVGTGVLYSVSGGLLRSETIGQPGALKSAQGGFSFAQISDSHIGFKREPNQDVTATLREAVERINACRDSMKMSPCELFRNVPFGVVRAARSAPANGAPVATPQAPSPMGAAWACGGSTPLATALLACHYDAPNKRGHFLVS